MKILPLTLAAALATYASFAQAQSTGSGISVLPPGSTETSKETSRETSKEPSKEKPDNPATNQGTTTGKASSARTDKPTNALNDKRVSPTTGNPGIQSGRVK